MSEENKNNLQNEGTFDQNRGLSTPPNHIDLDTDDAQKAFEEAFKKASGNPEPTVQAVTAKETPPTQVVEPPKQDAKTVDPAKTETTDSAPVQKQEQQTSEAKTDASRQEEPKREDPYAWIKELPEGIKDKVLKEISDRQYHEHKYKSDLGRQNALQQKTFRLERELAELRSKVVKPQDPTLAAAAQLDANKTLAEWNTLIEADPSLAKAVESRIKAERSAIKSEVEQQLKAQVDPLYQQNVDSYADRERQLLQQEVPNYAEVISSPVYNYWIANFASPGLQQLANTSNNHLDAVTVLKAYASEAPGLYEHMVRNGMIQGQLPTQQQQSKPPEQQQESKDTSHADKVAQARQQRVQTAPVVHQAPNPIQPPTTTGLGANLIGGQIDLEDASVLALFEDAYKKSSARR